VKTISINVSSAASGAFAYDLNGNTTSAAGLPAGDRTYDWDAADRVVAIHYTGTTRHTRLSYDGAGRWVKLIEEENGTTTSEKRFVWEGNAVAEERDVTGAVTNRFFEEGERRGTTAYYYFSDHLGSMREVTDGSGAVQARYDYDPYGRRTQISGSLDSSFGFTRHYFHQASGLLFAPFRSYDAELGRWLSRDPIHEEGGLNLYGYVRNNPINLRDPLGLIWYDNLTDWTRRKVDCGKSWLDDTLPWWLAGVGDTALDIVGGVGTIPGALGHLGEGSGTWAGDPTLENSPGLFLDIAMVASVIALVPEAGPLSSAGGTGAISSSGPDFVAASDGTVFVVPKGATGPTPTRAPGMQFTGGSGGNGLDSRVTGVRFMDANQTQGARGVYMNRTGQTVNPHTGRTVPPSDPSAHFYVKP
jgi:RHS repeat-associated protein